jgi:hypothetical protein
MPKKPFKTQKLPRPKPQAPSPELPPLQAASKNFDLAQTGKPEDATEQARPGETYGQWRRRVPLRYLTRLREIREGK